MSYEISVTHTIDAAHRVLGHKNPDGSPGKCSRLHGHTYGFTIDVVGGVLDEIGFVIDFGEIKRKLDEWDHRTLLWDQDTSLRVADVEPGRGWIPHDGLVLLPFNPTAENMAEHLASHFIEGFGLHVVQVEVREIAKTKAIVTRNKGDRGPWLNLGS